MYTNNVTVTKKVCKDIHHNPFEIIQISNDELTFDILIDRAMDLGSCMYKGQNIALLLHEGYSHPDYMDTTTDFFENAIGGLMFTTGLDNVGPSVEIDGYSHLMHGGFTYTKANNITINEDQTTITIIGTISQQRYFKQQLVVTRKITFDKIKYTIVINDTITNTDAIPHDYMLMYHCNFSKPLISKNTSLTIPSMNVIPRDDEAEKGIKDYLSFSDPFDHFKEQVFYHETLENPVSLSIKNKELGIIVSIEYDSKSLPKLTQWKMMNTSLYALGLEPGLHNPVGRNNAVLQPIQANEEHQYELKIKIKG